MSLTPEQLIERRNWIGASESPCLVGVSPFGNAHSVWASKMGLDIYEPTVAQDAGNWLEPAIGSWYAHDTGHRVASFGSVVHPRYPFMGCTPDLCISGERRIAQIKLVGMWMAHHWDEDVPEYVQVQVQHEMEVCDADVCDVIALIGGTDFRIIPVERDRELGRDLVDVCRDFMARFVVTREMPDPDGSSHATEAIKAHYQRRQPTLLAATPEAEKLGRRWLAADTRIRAAEREQTIAEQNLKVLIGEHEGIEGEAFRATWRPNKKGTRVFLCKELGATTKKEAA